MQIAMEITLNNITI